MTVLFTYYFVTVSVMYYFVTILGYVSFCDCLGYVLFCDCFGYVSFCDCFEPGRAGTWDSAGLLYVRHLLLFVCIPFVFFRESQAARVGDPQDLLSGHKGTRFITSVYSTEDQIIDAHHVLGTVWHGPTRARI